MCIEKVYEGFMHSHNISAVQAFCKEVQSFAEVGACFYAFVDAIHNCFIQESGISPTEDISTTTIPMPFLIIKDSLLTQASNQVWSLNEPALLLTLPLISGSTRIYTTRILVLVLPLCVD